MASGILYVIATPIGNMEDITLRALRILREKVSAVYCEDTRQSRRLLSAYGINIQTKSLHAHSDEQRIEEACMDLLAGKSIGYMTDAGTPAVSDPGSRLVKAARDRGITVVPVPGASAVTALVSASGFSETNIVFAGFLSKKPGKRLNELKKLSAFPGIIVLYESPYRIKKLIEAIASIFPDSQILLGREMTKRFEEFISGTASELLLNIDSITEKGEFAVAVWNRT